MEEGFEEYKEILQRMLSFPLKSQIKIDFNFSTKSFLLSLPIYVASDGLPAAVKDYVEARKDHCFKPYETQFLLDGATRVILIQTLPFRCGFQPGLREQILAFWKLAKYCHRLLVELALEEKYRSALYLDSDLEL
jgi:hypothetical protein